MPLDPTRRLSNIEALRLLALGLIVGVHVSTPGVINQAGGSSYWLAATLVNTYSRFGVDLFVLIGAYFMCTRFLDLRGIARRWAQIFYPLLVLSVLLFIFSPPTSSIEVGSYALSVLAGAGEVEWHGVWLGQLWFIFPFALLIALSPLLNHAIRSMSRREHRTAILILMAIFVGIPTINAFAGVKLVLGTYDTGTSLAYFITLYFVAAYIRNYDVRIAPIKGVATAVVLGFLAFILICLYSLLLSYPTPYPSGAYDYFQGNNTLFIFAGSVMLFLAFRSMDFQNRGISFAGKLTYEAFLFHTVLLYLLAAYWPLAASSDLGPGSYTSLMLLIILLVVLVSLGYGLGRFYMDQGLTKLVRRYGLKNARRWIEDRFR